MKLIDRILRQVYPQGVVCVRCGRLTDRASLCVICREELQTVCLTGELCGICGQPLDESGACPLCARGWMPEACSVWQHKSAARDLVHLLKFHNRREAAIALADGMAALAAEMTQGADAVVSWVPMPESRYCSREYDHAELIAEQLARRIQLPLIRTLNRVEGQQPLARQLGLTGEERRKNLVGSFVPACEHKGTILLIDDVMTTGATAVRASECLLMNGAQRVMVMTATRAVEAQPMDMDKGGML